MLRESQAGVLVVSLLVKRVGCFTLNARRYRDPLRSTCCRPFLYVLHQRRANAGAASIFEDNERREPGDGIIVVDRWEYVASYQSNDFAITIRGDECCCTREICNGGQSRGNLRFGRWIAE